MNETLLETPTPVLVSAAFIDTQHLKPLKPTVQTINHLTGKPMFRREESDSIMA